MCPEQTAQMAPGPRMTRQDRGKARQPLVLLSSCLSSVLCPLPRPSTAGRFHPHPRPHPHPLSPSLLPLPAPPPAPRRRVEPPPEECQPCRAVFVQRPCLRELQAAPGNLITGLPSILRARSFGAYGRRVCPRRCRRSKGRPYWTAGTPRVAPAAAGLRLTD